MDEKRDVQAKIRMPCSLHDKLRVSAALSRRSLNQEIIYRLVQTLGEGPTPEEQAVLDRAEEILAKRFGALPPSIEDMKNG